MLAAALQRIANDRPGFVRRVSEATGIDDSTIYKWIAGSCEPGFRNVQLMFRGCDDPDVQRVLLDVFAGGTSWRHRIEAAPDEDALDCNGDGEIDLGDALDAAIDADELLACQLKHLREVHRRDPEKISPADRELYRGLANKTTRELDRVMNVIDHLHHQREQRRLALRPPRLSTPATAKGGA